MESYKILVTDKISRNGIKILQDERFNVEEFYNHTEDEISSKINEFHALIVRGGTKVTKKIIEGANNLKVIGRAGSGVDNIDVEASTKKGILVMNTPGGNTLSTAEHTISLLLSLLKNIPQATSSLKSQKWERSKFMGREFGGKTLGIIGFGKIGEVVAEMALGLRMKVIVSDPYISAETIKNKGVIPSSLDELLKNSDFITIHTPLNNETKKMIREKEIEKMKDGVFIINCARGGIIDEKALYDALTKRKVAGAALDVFEKEPAVDNPLLQLENVIATPHIGAATVEAQERVGVMIAEQIRDYLLYRKTNGSVNLKYLPAQKL